MKTSILSPHDRFFRTMLLDPKVAKEFFEQCLPQDILSIVKLDTICIQKDSFIDDHLKLQMADLLYAAQFGEQEGYLYLLIEQQSIPDKLMAFRVLKYMMAIMEHHLKVTKKSQLPVIYPMIVYTGKHPYRYSTDLFDLFNENKFVMKNVLFHPYQLIDFSKIQDEKLKDCLRFDLMVKAMKHIRSKDFLTHLKDMMNGLKILEGQGEKEYIYTVLTYVVEAGKNIDSDAFIETVATGLTHIDKEEVMTIANQFRQAGRKEGRQEGRQEGLQEGKIEGLREGKIVGIREGKMEGIREGKYAIALKMLEMGLSIDQIASCTELPILEIESLKKREKKTN